MMEAYKVSKKRMNYNNEKLYNVLMEEHNKMNVNNMIVETLDPTNIIGKVFKGLRELV
jgi:beta-xylosidase